MNIMRSKSLPSLFATLLTFASCLLPSTSWSATIAGSGPVPANTYGNTYATLNLPSDFTIGNVSLTATFSPGKTSTGNNVPLQAGYVWLELTRLGNPGTGEADTTITLFDFPHTYPYVPTDPSCSGGGSFDYSCINTVLDGTYVFNDSAPTDFDSATINAIDGTLASGTYSSSTGSLDSLIGAQANATYRVRTGSYWSGTYGHLDWQLQLTAVPVPAAVWLFSSGLLGLAGFAKRKKA